MSLSNGLLNLTNWLGNVIMPTMAGLFAAAAIYRFSKAHPYSHLGYAALASSAVLRVVACDGVLQQPGILEQPRSLLDFCPDTGELDWQCFVAALWRRPGCARGCALCRLTGAHDDRRGLGAQPNLGDVLLQLVGLLRLGEFWIQHGTGGVR